MKIFRVSDYEYVLNEKYVWWIEDGVLDNLFF